MTSLFCLPSPSSISIKLMSHLLTSSHKSFFFSTFQLESFHWFLSSTVKSTDEAIKSFLISVTVDFSFSISFRLFLTVSLPLLMLPICFCILSTVTIRALNTLIIIILNSPSNNSSIWGMSESGTMIAFSSDSIFLAFWHTLQFFVESWTCSVK